MRNLLFLMLLSTTVVYGTTVQDSIVALVPHDSAVYRHGYMELKTVDRAQYDTMMGSILRFEANNYSAYYFHKCPLMGVDNMRNGQLVAKDLMRMCNDMPELYILASTVASYDYSSYYYYAKIGYKNTPTTYLQDLKAMRAAYENCAKGITDTMSTYLKIKTLHDNYCRWFTYGDVTGGLAGTAKGALINRRAVCQGIAYGWLYLCQQAGLKCIYVSGRQGMVNHSWNFIEVDGQWYLIDLTVDGGLVGVDVGYAAFLKGSNYFNTHYSLLNSDGSDPNCNGVYQSLPTLAKDDYSPHSIPTDMKDVTASPARSFIKVIKNGRLYIFNPQNGLFLLPL